MVEFSIKVHREQQLAYLPNAIVKLLGYDLTLIPNSKCAVLFSKGTAISFVLKSLDVITREIELMHQMEEMVQATDEKKESVATQLSQNLDKRRKE